MGQTLKKEVQAEAVFDRIERSVVLKAPLSRVFRALVDSREFGEWFGFRFDGEFEVGRPMRGTFVEAFDEASMMAYHASQGVEPFPIRQVTADEVFCTIEVIDPETYFAFRWVPYPLDRGLDPDREPKTLVEFRLSQVDGGTRLDVSETGFSRVPEARRLRAFRMNQGGWGSKVEALRRYVEVAGT